MSLKKQLFTAFITVAVLPLLIVGVFMFASNITLAFELHKQNLLDSTEIQADYVEENINRLMVRAKNLAASASVQSACQKHDSDENIGELSADILSFTDETLDNVAIFALMNQQGEILYSSGSNSDRASLEESLPRLKREEKKGQFAMEISFSNQGNSLIIYTPVEADGAQVGSFLMVCRTDYFLKIISGQRQLKSSNTFIYCRPHKEVVTAKQDISVTLPDFDDKIGKEKEGSALCQIEGESTLVYYCGISKTPWLLVSAVSTKQIFSQVINYGLISVSAIVAVVLIILYLTKSQSRKVLRPMDQLLEAVETFFLDGAEKFPKTEIDPRTEIGYLAEKFAGMSDDIALAQGKLRESNYLYAALLQATFEFRIVIDFQSGTVECSSGSLNEHLKNIAGETPSDRVLSLLNRDYPKIECDSILHRIVFGRMTGPLETEVCLKQDGKNEVLWYRVVAVPVLQGERVWRVALHFEDITEKKREEFRLILSSQTDPLCGLLNKNTFLQSCKLSKNGKTDALFFIDLDHFKQVNDTLGHSAGDDVLLAASHAIRTQFREDDVIGRFGGDEFVIFAPGINKEAAEKKAVRLLQAISFYLDTPKGKEIHVTASVGVCMALAPATFEQVIKLADEAMYRAKEKGRAQYCFSELGVDK